MRRLDALKQRPGRTVLLSCGPGTLGSLAATPGLIDEYSSRFTPEVIGAGPLLFDGLSTDLALRLLEAKVFDGGCVMQRYEIVPPTTGSEVVGLTDQRPFAT